jgi:hypothetical protein
LRLARSARSFLGWTPAVLYAAFLWWLSSRPTVDLPVAVSDKLVHAGAFGLLAVLLWRGFSGGYLLFPRPWGAPAVLALCTLYAGVDEIHQAFVPGRISSLADAVADVAGSGAAILVLWGLATLRDRVQGGSRGRAKPAEDRAPVLTLLSKSDCHLCDEAEEVLLRVRSEIPFELEKVDIDSSEELSRAYGQEVPVVLFHGRKIFKYRVDPDRLRERLLRAGEEGKP